MKFKDLVAKLEDYYQHDKKSDVGLSIIESTLGVILGALISYLITSYDHFTLSMCILVLIIFVFLLYRRLSKNYHFSSSAVGELKSSSELIVCEKEIGRKRILNDYVDDSIVALNSKNM